MQLFKVIVGLYKNSRMIYREEDHKQKHFVKKNDHESPKIISFFSDIFFLSFLEDLKLLRFQQISSIFLYSTKYPNFD